MRSNWKKRSCSIAIAGAILLMAALAGFSQGPERPRRGFPGGPGGEGPREGIGLLPRDLNLTDDQKAQIRKITDNFEESTKSLRDQLKALHASEPDPFSGAFDEAAVRAAAEARAKIDIELSVARAQLMSRIGASLTTEQKAQIAAKRAEFAQRLPQSPQ